MGLKKLKKAIAKRLKLNHWHFSTSSLQFRLTFELAGLSICGLGIVAIWAGWQMEQNLVAAHKQTLDYIASRFPEQLELYSEMEPVETSLVRTLQRVTTADVMAWVKDPDGQLVTQSTATADFVAQVPDLMTFEQGAMPPQIVRVGDRQIVLCISPLAIAGEPVGQLYLSQDITADLQKLYVSLWRLRLVSGATLILLIAAIIHRIQKVTQPLAQMSNMAQAISADDLQGAKLELQQAPDEILGLAQVFNEMLSRLSSAWDNQRQFVGNVSHELRTPLTIIEGYLQSLLRREDSLSEYQQQAIATAATETTHTIQMLQDLLDLARADGGHLHFRTQPVMLNTFLEEVSAMGQQINQRPIHLKTPPEDVVIRADQDRLQQVMLNLIDNALKYSAPDQAIEICLETASPMALIHIIDQGIGIALAHQARIFERFYRVDETMTRSRDGTGLGLAIAKSLIEGMGGKISLRSQPHQGSCFTLKLPLWDIQSVSTSHNSEQDGLRRHG
ncbi:sensor histidine kinase [Picosynechococcus sp. PCC 73109]|uniref:sensor histidine kinase n=1 Tax=Picosynechococcus sp. PCC 73109 TaxID=374982 RepID=UPI000A9F2679|nr:HAMP domain-containing sensor histidine kinase [Picosynechococcus sp. PCC 73109]